jgi:glycyl-tRNA synthetase beta chain
LRAPIDVFFDSVVVNDDDDAVRMNRLGLLAMVRDAMTRVADFTKLEG